MSCVQSVVLGHMENTKKKSLKYGPFLKEVDQMLEHLLLSVRKYVDTLRILICKNLVR